MPSARKLDLKLLLQSSGCNGSGARCQIHNLSAFVNKCSGNEDNTTLRRLRHQFCIIFMGQGWGLTDDLILALSGAKVLSLQMLRTKNRASQA